MIFAQPACGAERSSSVRKGNARSEHHPKNNKGTGQDQLAALGTCKPQPGSKLHPVNRTPHKSHLAVRRIALAALFGPTSATPPRRFHKTDHHVTELLTIRA